MQTEQMTKRVAQWLREDIRDLRERVVSDLKDYQDLREQLRQTSEQLDAAEQKLAKLLKEVGIDD